MAQNTTSPRSIIGTRPRAIRWDELVFDQLGILAYGPLLSSAPSATSAHKTVYEKSRQKLVADYRWAWVERSTHIRRASKTHKSW